MVFSISLGAVVLCRLGWLPAVPRRVLVSLPEIQDISLLEEPVSFEILFALAYFKHFPFVFMGTINKSLRSGLVVTLILW